MIVGVPREIKVQEYRVALTPEGVAEFIKNGHSVIVENNAGIGSSISNESYVAAGATIIESADQLWQQADLILKVKEPIAAEYSRMRENQILFTYLHLAASKACTDALIKSKTTAIAYETVEVDGSLPLLIPMSEVAGRMATQVGADALLKPKGGRGVLLAGVPGVSPGKVIVIGAGIAGLNAAVIALGMGADITVLDKSAKRLAHIDQVYGGRIKTLMSSTVSIQKSIYDADLVIGAVLIPGAKAPKVVTNQDVAKMKSGSVLVDIAIDQGGCFEDSKPTTHENPTYQVHESIFYCVANMPGAVPVTSTYALTNVTLPFALQIANLGWHKALAANPNLAKGLNTHDGKVTYKAVAEAHGYEFSPIF
ncbi:MAG: alanine dehydrogenase [Actinobacteria bacterium]|nr:alanine dehydrogenase [Actinomycetota bacterium]